MRAFALAAATIIGVVGFARSGFAIDDHRAVRTFVETALAQIRADVATQPPGTTVYLENGVLPFTLTGPMINQAMLPGRAALFVLVAPSGVLDGRRVRFVETDPNVFLYQDRAPKLGALLVPPGRPRRPAGRSRLSGERLNVLATARLDLVLVTRSGGARRGSGPPGRPTPAASRRA